MYKQNNIVSCINLVFSNLINNIYHILYDLIIRLIHIQKSNFRNLYMSKHIKYTIYLHFLIYVKIANGTYKNGRK
jgi:hypothetical protein